MVAFEISVKAILLTIMKFFFLSNVLKAIK